MNQKNTKTQLRTSGLPVPTHLNAGCKSCRADKANNLVYGKGCDDCPTGELKICVGDHSYCLGGEPAGSICFCAD